MQIEPVDSENNLFSVTDALSQGTITKILNTDWLAMPHDTMPHQQSWLRRSICSRDISWIDDFENDLRLRWDKLKSTTNVKLHDHVSGDTTFWVDVPGFTVGTHTDGELAGALQLSWISPCPNLGTAFHQYKNGAGFRFCASGVTNSGYLMINKEDENHYRKLLWHSMMTPVPQNTIRVTSYTVLRYD